MTAFETFLLGMVVMALVTLYIVAKALRPPTIIT